MPVDVTILRLGHQGDGIAEGPLFVENALPGEVVQGRPEGQSLQDGRILNPSSDRVKPPCRHFPACGGCRLQHASDSFLADWKVDVVRQALRAHDLSAAFLPIHVSPARSRRRAAFAARRTKKGAMAGFHARGSEVLIETPDCHLLHPELLRARPVAEALARIGASRKHALSVVLTLSPAGVDAHVTGGKALENHMRVELAAVAETFDLARLCWAEEPIVIRRLPVQTFGTAQVIPPPGAFLQATADGEAALQADVRHHLRAARRVADLFAGCGTFALDLARTHEVHAVEGDPAMTAALDHGWRQAEGLRTVTHEARDLFRRPLMPDELARFDAVVLDPPRAGAEAQIREIAEARVPNIAYVSCNPVSFARDAAILRDAGYQMGDVRVVDQFRWSAHVEIVSNLRIK